MRKQKGRPPTKGRFVTRNQLEYEIWQRYKKTHATQADIARACGVSEGVVRAILADTATRPHVFR